MVAGIEIAASYYGDCVAHVKFDLPQGKGEIIGGRFNGMDLQKYVGKRSQLPPHLGRDIWVDVQGDIWEFRQLDGSVGGSAICLYQKFGDQYIPVSRQAPTGPCIIENHICTPMRQVTASQANDPGFRPRSGADYYYTWHGNQVLIYREGQMIFMEDVSTGESHAGLPGTFKGKWSAGN